MMAKTLIKYLLFICVSIGVMGFAVYYPIFQKNIPSLQALPLSGAFSVTENPQLLPKTWLNAAFQKSYGGFLQENPEVRPLMVRLKNEWLMKAFDVSPHPNILIGEDGYLFEKSYVKASLGLDDVGDDSLKNIVDRLEEVKTELQNKGIPILLLLPPAKATHIPDKLPPSFASLSSRKTNRHRMIELCVEKQIPVIDFSYFQLLEKETGHNLYPQAGLHWSKYGALMAADTMSRKINELLDIRLPKMHIDSIFKSSSVQSPDNELGELLNLYQSYVYDEATYAQFSFEHDSTTKKPKALILGDSYYRLLFDMKIHQQIFDTQSQYWHYFQKHIDPKHTEGVPVNTSYNYINQVLSDVDIVIFVNSTQNVPRLGFGFLEAMLANTPPQTN